MSRKKLIMVVCACSWSGAVATRGTCPACHGNHNDRINDTRARALETLTINPDFDLMPVMRRRFKQLGLITAANVLTERGVMARDAFRAAKAAELRRKVAGETARRHADLP